MRLFLFILFLMISVLVKAHPSWGLVRDKDGNLFFADITHNDRGSLWQLTPKGKLILLASDFHAHNVSLDADGHIISAHGEEHHTMIRIKQNGEIDTLISRNNPEEFFGGNCSYTPWGEIIFSIDGFIWRINAYGEREKISDHHFEWNQSLLATQDGSVYATEIGNGRGEIWRIDPDGSSSLIATDLISKFADRDYDKHNDVLLGMAQDSKGIIYIAELAGQRIVKIDKEGNRSNYYQSSGSWYPTAVFPDHERTYILEYRDSSHQTGPRIVILENNGEVSTLFDYDRYLNSHSPEIRQEISHPLPHWPRLVFILIGVISIFVYFQKVKRTSGS